MKVFPIVLNRAHLINFLSSLDRIFSLVGHYSTTLTIVYASEIVLRLQFSWSISSIFNFMDTLKVFLDLGEVVLHFLNFTQHFKLTYYHFATFLSRIPSSSGFFQRPDVRKKCLAKWEITNMDTKR